MRKPDYGKIYMDMILEKFPDKMEACHTIIAKQDLTFMDIMAIQNKLFGNLRQEDTEKFNQQHKSYDVDTIQKILNYQKEQQLNNSQLARHFRLSRNTVTKWKKLFP